MRRAALRPRTRGHALVAAALLLAACSRATTPPVTIRGGVQPETPIRRVAVGGAVAADRVAPLGDEAVRAVSEMMINAAARQSPRWTLVTAEAEPSDATLSAEIARYREREGSDYGARSGAAVSLKLLLTPRGAKEPVLVAEYSAEQEPLTYNLLGFWQFQRGGMRWLTVAELARIGVDEAVTRLAAATK